MKKTMNIKWNTDIPGKYNQKENLMEKNNQTTN